MRNALTACWSNLRLLVYRLPTPLTPSWIVPKCVPETMPHDVVTMNSRVKFRNLSDGEVRVRTLVYPATMTDSSTQLSVMAPVGAALLGLRVGDTIHWELPGGTSTHLEVIELEYQPEAAGDYLR
jgi:regulator of nucleoside diphosphate kinase